MTGTLTLVRPKPGVVTTFDAREYSLIDFVPIEYQWTALVQVGITLRIVFSDGSVIELLNFYSFSLAGDTNGDDHTGALADGSGDLLVLTSATGMMSKKEFVRTYWTTKSSGYVAVPAFERHDGEQASGGLTGQNAPDQVPLSFPPPPSASGGVEFPLLPVPPSFFLPVPPSVFLPPQVTHPPNNAAVISGDSAGSVIEAGGVANAVPGIPVATGDLFAADTDNPDDLWEAVGSPAASINGYGSYTLTAVGVWTYTLDNSNPTVQALNAGQTLTDSFTVTTVDGTSQLVTITITGANDAPVITGTASGNVTEAGGLNNGTPGTPTATGDLNSTDVDNPSDAWTAVSAPTASGYGSYALSAAGVWTYTLDNNNATVQALNVGGTLTDSFTATTIDGTSQLVTITITGANDAPVVTAAVDSGVVTEGSLSAMTATGTIDFGDVDLVDAHVTSVTPGGSGYLGTFVANVVDDSTGDGSGQVSWLFLGTNQLRQSLQVGQQLVQTYTVDIDDGHGGTASQLVTITINGTNNAAVITGDTVGSVVEAGGVANAIPGIPAASGDLFADDTDDPDDAWEVVGSATASASGYGSYTLTAAGVWTYTLNNSNAAVQALNVGQTLTDTFTATTIDGTSQVVTITITGANDAPVISGTTSGNVTEAGGVNNATPGTPTATGDLNATDVDNPSDGWTAVSASAASVYGSYTLTAAWRLDLHAQQRQRHGAGAQCRADADRQLHRHHDRRHVAAGDRHHHRRQRRAGDQRHHIGQRDRSRRGQ